MLKLNKENLNLIWQSDFNGPECGYEEIPVVGFYMIEGENILLLIDTSKDEILDIQNVS